MMRPNAYAFACGALERSKGVVLYKEHGAYIVIRPGDGSLFGPRRRRVEGARTLKAARKLAAELRREADASSEGE